MRPGAPFALVTLASVATAWLAGCERQPAGAALPAIRPGLAALRIEVVARPKSGYEPPSAYDRVDVPDDPYATVNYDRLEDVIIWLELQDQAMAPAAPAGSDDPMRIPLARPEGPARMAWHVARADVPVILQNANTTPDRFYSVTDGNPFDTGDLAAHAEATVLFRRLAGAGGPDSQRISAQVVEVLSSRHDEPIAGIVVVPTVWAASTRSGRAVTFTDLPPGSFRVVCWHPRLPGAEQQIRLQPDKLTRTQISIGVDSLPAAP